MKSELRPGDVRIGWIGTGVMGAPMAGHLLRAGYRLAVHTRTKSKAQPLLDAGATWAPTPAAAANAADFAISIVGFPEDVEETHLGDYGTLAADEPPGVVVDMTTSRPSLAVELARRAAARGVEAVDAPVSGGDVGARDATLSIMVGASPEAFERTLPVLRHLGKRVVRQGGAGAGQHTKMANQISIATMMIGACEALLYASAAGLDLDRVIETVGSGAAGSWTINNLGPRMVRRDFNPGFFVKHFIKDLGIALDEASRMRLALPGLGLAKQLYEAVRAQGHGRLGTQSLLLALETLNNRAASEEVRTD